MKKEFKEPALSPALQTMIDVLKFDTSSEYIRFVMELCKKFLTENEDKLKNNSENAFVFLGNISGVKEVGGTRTGSIQTCAVGGHTPEIADLVYTLLEKDMDIAKVMAEISLNRTVRDIAKDRIRAINEMADDAVREAFEGDDNENKNQE